MFAQLKNRQISITIFFILSFFFVTNARFWQNIILEEANNKISPTNYKILTGRMYGSILGDIKIKNLIIIHPNIGEVHIKSTVININFISSLFNKLTFDEIEIHELKPIKQTYQSKNHVQISGLNKSKPNFNVDKFYISGEIPFRIQNDLLIFAGELEGSIITKNELEIVINSLKLKNLDYESYFLSLNKAKIIVNENGLEASEFIGEIGNAPIKGILNYLYEESKFIGEVTIDNFHIPADLFSRTPLKGKFSEFSGKVNFESNKDSISGGLSISNKLGLEMRGEIFLIKKDSNILLRSLNLYGEDSNLKLNGVWEKSGRVSGYFYLDSLDLSRWLINQDPTLLSGMAILESTIGESKALENIELTLEVAEFGVFSTTESSFHGTVIYSDSIISTVDPVMLIIGQSILSLDGNLNLKSRELDIIADLENADINIINKFWIDEFTNGTASGKLRIRGTIDNPDAVADLNCRNIIYRDFYLNSLNFHSEMKSESDFPKGFVNLKIDEGKWKKEKFDSGTLDISFSKDRIIVENCHFKDGDDYLLISGSWLSNNKYKIDHLQAARGDNYLINAKPIFIIYEDSLVSVEPFELHINDGILDGILSLGEYSEGIFKMSNFDANVITQFTENNYFNLSGVIFGEVSFKDDNDNFSYDIDLSLKKGFYMDEPFDQMNIALLYKSDFLHVDDISMTKDTTMGIQLTGVLPLKKSVKNKKNISLSTTFKGLSLPMIHNLIPNFYNIEGRAKGSLKVFGNLSKTKFNYKASVHDAVFDKIFLGYVESKGSYNGEDLNVEYANSNNLADKITSYGSIPFDLNLNSNSFGKFFTDGILDFHSDAKLSSLFFLSPYFSEIDSINGLIDINLSLVGPSSKIIRNGDITIKNSSIYTMLINNPLINVHGKAIMNNNNLSIGYLEGASIRKSLDDRDNKNNIKVSGFIDFSSFFRPRYNLLVESIKQSNIYIETLPIDLDGYVDSINVTIIGRDTVDISGMIEAVDLTLFHEFNSEDIGTSLVSENEVVLSYNINVPIKGTGKFQNSQVDAIMIGEISLSKIGNQFWNLGGELFIEDGSIFSFKDNFKNLNGYVTFDNIGINPTMDLSSSTNIDSEEIRLRIMGNLDDADLILESSSGFSESDILELLTFGKRFEDQETTSTGFGIQANSVLGTLLESQIEKNLEELSVLRNLAPDEVDITGSAGFISSGMYSGERDNLEDFKISAKKKFGDKTYANLSYKKSFSLTNPDQLQIGVEYKLSRNLSLVGNMDDQGNLHLKYRYRYAY